MKAQSIDLYDLTLEEMQRLVKDIGEPAFRAKQVYDWLYKGISDFSDMKNLPKSFIAKLSAVSEVKSLKIIKKQVSEIDKTAKYLFDLLDDNAIESVFMKYKYGNSICISSQVGCRMGCKFCASGLDGLVRNLTAAEMIKQIVAVQKDTGEKISNIVVMGTGEPFDNYENLSKFIRLANSKNGLGIGMRNITVSTCGIVPRIADFAEDFPQVNLAISLHETEDVKRDMLMPINKKYKIEEVISVCKDYFEKTGRRVTFEYALICGVNDGKKDMEKIARLLKGFPCHINLISLNEVKETGLKSSGRKAAQAATDYLNSLGINATLRRKLGEDIDGACGQLRRVQKIYKT